MREYDEITSGTGDDGPERSRRPPPGAGRLLTGVAMIAALTVLATGHGPRLSSVEERPQLYRTPVPSKASTPAAPVAAPAPSPTHAPTTYPPDLGESGPPGVAFAVGSVIHDGDRLVGLPEGWRVNSLWTVPGGWLVSAKRLSGPPVLAKVDHSGAIRDIGTVGLVPSSRWTAAVDPRGTHVAWASTSGQGRFRLRVSDTTTGELRFSMRLPFPPLFHDWVRGKGPLVSPALHPEGAPVVVDLRTRRLRPVVNAAAGPQPGFVAYSPRSDHLVLSRVLRAEFEDTCRPLSKAELPVSNVTCRASRGLGAFSPGRRNGEHLAVSSLSTIDVRLTDGGKRRVFRGPGNAYVEQLVWEDRRAFLASLVYIRNGTSLVLRCTVEGGCRRAYQPSPDEQVVLARG